MTLISLLSPQITLLWMYIHVCQRLSYQYLNTPISTIQSRLVLLTSSAIKNVLRQGSTISMKQLSTSSILKLQLKQWCILLAIPIAPSGPSRSTLSNAIKRTITHPHKPAWFGSPMRCGVWRMFTLLYLSVTLSKSLCEWRSESFPHGIINGSFCDTREHPVKLVSIK